MNRPQSTSDDWLPCEPGTLQQIADQQRRKRRIATTRRIALPVAVLGLLVAVGMNIGSRSASEHKHHGGLSCAEFAAHIEAFAKHQVDPGLAAKMLQHADDCPRCQQKLHALQSGTAQRDAVTTPSWSSPLRQAIPGSADMLAVADRR
ncbi:hypothetical protein Poly24_43050 [Rosistilla carotiformis]|uniref:Zinc-finger domain-containing protein n=1 Tax=Rosistilla carotiformis TaxID=2528017 RepID=A0A518JYG6_9BACT|nr:hypothetical protein [Rosistilla carotiformis]QDV70581.1 hypothetical protein Poly24_43050 [Rosistilla carotiformis]